jgi:hypothetical protein
MVATFGLPGWVAFEARGSLAKLAAGGPWNLLLVVAGFLTLPTYFRILALGFGPSTSHVDRAAPERVRSARLPRLGVRGDGLQVEQEGADVAASPAGDHPAVPASDAPASSRRARPGVRATQPAAVTAAPTTSATGPSTGTGTTSGHDAVSPGSRTRLGGAGSAGSRFATASVTRLRRDRAELLSAGVLALALLASLVAWGVLDIGHAAAEPAPAVVGTGAD